MTQQDLAEFPEFTDRHKFQDDVWGQITLNSLERDVIDTPEFQRLFRTSQLGFVDLVYQTANHTRGTHSIGACHVVANLMNRLRENTDRLRGKDPRYAPIKISRAEQVLIRLGALLHDISHLPLSHDLERKTHKILYFDRNKPPLKLRSHYGHYDKHDDYERNPLLYILLCNEEISVLARVLRHYSKPFYALLRQCEKMFDDYQHLKTFLSTLSKVVEEEWNPNEKLLPALLFHLLIYEDPEDYKDPEGNKGWEREIAINFDSNGSIVTSRWGLGPSSLRQELHKWWYQPFRHDIIGNTLSADLIDYLRRDPQRLGIDRHIDQHLLDYYVLVSKIWMLVSRAIAPVTKPMLPSPETFQNVTAARLTFMITSAARRV